MTRKSNTTQHRVCAIAAILVGLRIGGASLALASPEQQEIDLFNRVRADLFEELDRTRGEVTSLRAQLEAALKAQEQADAQEIARLDQVRALSEELVKVRAEAEAALRQVASTQAELEAAYQARARAEAELIAALEAVHPPQVPNSVPQLDSAAMSASLPPRPTTGAKLPDPSEPRFAPTVRLKKPGARAAVSRPRPARRAKPPEHLLARLFGPPLRRTNVTGPRDR